MRAMVVIGTALLLLLFCVIQISPLLEMQMLDRRQQRANCLERRGKNGTWVPAEGYNYDGFEDAAKLDSTKSSQWCQGGCPSTKWKWRDGESNCQITLLAPDGLCKIMQKLQLERIFVVGDSLGNQMAKSLFHLLGYNDPIKWEDALRQYNHTFHCDDTFTYEVTFTRNDHLSNHTNRTGACGDICTPWFERYVANPTPTLLILNIGAHVPTPEEYKSDLDAAVKMIQKTSRPQDRIVFRTSVPGHEYCDIYEEPFADVSEYNNGSQTHQRKKVSFRTYNWKYVEGFNRHTKQKLSNLANEGGWMFLDVFPMTVLRPDGHRAPSRQPPDCLHYLNPGPIDWWNHLLYSQLLDLSTVEMTDVM